MKPGLSFLMQLGDSVRVWTAAPVGPRTFGQELAMMAKSLVKAGLAYAHTISNLGLSWETIGRFVLISEKPPKKHISIVFLLAEKFQHHRPGFDAWYRLNCVSLVILLTKYL